MSPRKSLEKPKRPLFRRINEWLHLWLGLASGIVVFAVCLTAALWVFRYEVWYFTEPYQRVEVLNKPFLPPSALMAKASAFAQRAEGKPVEFTSITYGTFQKSAFVTYRPEKGKFYSIYLNPYDAKVLYHKKARRRPKHSSYLSEAVTGSFSFRRKSAVRSSVLPVLFF